LQVDPQNTKAQEIMEISMAQQGNSRDAIMYYRKALQRDPSNPYINYLLGEALAKQGQSDEAILYLKEILWGKDHLKIVSSLV
jgi:predicted Zn-dependent protease